MLLEFFIKFYIFEAIVFLELVLISGMFDKKTSLTQFVFNSLIMSLIWPYTFYQLIEKAQNQ